MVAGACLAMAASQAATPLADQPLFSNIAVPGNLALALSVEWPTVSRVAHPSSTYTSNTAYKGYFDHNKCYRYQHVPAETATNVSHFYPVGTATDRKCPATGNNGDWSGNFLNWATMIAIDPFRWALTGGLRKVDTSTTTILERARHSGQGNLFPNRSLTDATLISNATPFTWSNLHLRVDGVDTRLLFTGTSGSLGDPNSGTAYTPGTPPSSYEQGVDTSDGTVYQLQVRVKVCDPALGVDKLEANCRAYGSNYKPEGLVQQYADRMRYSAFGYLNDSNMLRDGGVLRARQKFVGPTQTVPGSAPIGNPAKEWDPATGVFDTNPDATDAATTSTNMSVTVNNSGFINYLNKFGQLTTNPHKDYDPVSEMYYAVTRYFRNIGSVPEWTAIGSADLSTRSRWVDGFPVITNWTDPMLYSCQRNFVLGIGDIYTHRDKNLPGAGTGSTDEPTKPADVAADSGVNSVTETSKAFSLQGLADPSLSDYSGRKNSAGMVGLAYHANTRDLRADLPGKQTMSTYWVDVLEAPFVNNNQFLLAAKYGGFKVPEGFNPLTHSSPLPEAWWYTTGDLLPGSAKRPDNYFTAGAPDQMIDGLTKAFASIASALKAFTTSFSTSLPQVSVAGNASYAARFDAENWTGEVSADQLAFDVSTGEPTRTPAWSLGTKLATQLAGTGWDTGRRVVTWNPGTGAGVPFRAGVGGVSDTQLAALDTAYRTGNDSADYLNYLRGERLHEQASTDAGSSKAYRTRTGLLGDVVGSKARPVGPPSLPLSNASNPGYGAFKSTWAARPTMVYVGANDGMLHAVNGSLTGADAGREIFAYVPSALFAGPTATPGINGLAALGNPSFVHHYYVNATPGVFDIDLNRTVGASGAANWRSVLIGGLGKGGRSYYALDVTDPAAMNTEASAAAKVLWEFTDTDLGYTYGEPLVVKTRKYGWVVILPSGYNNSGGQGYFFIVNPRTGALLEKIGTGAGAGLAHVNAFVIDRSDGVADAAYAGDLEGNLWRLDLTPQSGDYAAPTRIATLTNASGQAQPVTTRPLIEVDPKTGRRFVMVGTGVMLDNSDIGSTVQNTFYAIVDGKANRFNASSDLPTGISFPITRSKLADNTNLLDDISYDLGTQIGWYIEMGTGGSGSVGWRVVNDPSSAFGVVTFASTLPNGDACNPSGISRIYAVNFGTGKSVLTSATGTISYYTDISGVVTDLRFFTVNGVPRLIAGSDNGELKSVPSNLNQPGTLRRLNWRELPLAN
jgi:type IV pilus assembly protein PilY1